MSFLDKARPVSQATSSQPSFLAKATPVEPEKTLGRKTAEVLAPSTTNLSDYVRASTRLKSGEVANIQKEREAVQAGITQMEQMLPSRPDLAQSIAESKQRIAEIDKDVAGVVSKADKTTGQKAGMALGTGLELGSLPELASLGLGKAFGTASTKKVLEIAPKNKIVQAITKATTVAPKTAQQDLAYKLAPLSGKAKTIAKETAKVLPETLAFGYGYDVSTGLQDKAEQPFAPGAGTVMGASIPVAIGTGRLVKNAMFKPAEKKIADIITRRERELYNIENNYSLLRKNMNFSKDANAASRRRIASTDILANAVDDTGTIRTTNPGGPVDQYRDQVLHGSEAIVRKNLEREGAYTTPDVIRKKIEKVIGDSRLTMDEKETAFSGIDKILTGFQRQYPDGKIPLVAIQDEKVNAGALAYRNLDPAIKTRLKDLTRAYKEVLEESSNLNVKEMNDELAKYLKDISLLESLDGRKVKGGKLGKYFAQISGNLIGGTTGSAIGGVPGAAIGTVIGGELASRIKGTALSRTLAGETGQVGVKSPVLKEAQQKATSPRLQLPAPKFGRDYVQSNKSGNLNQRYADTAITSNIGNIDNSVSLTADSASVQDMKLAEDFLNSQPNATIEADQIKAKELLGGLNAQLEALDSMDSMNRLKKFVGTRGEFKGELNLNNGKGKFGSNPGIRLNEAVPGSDGKTAEEMADKYYSWINAKQSIKENVDSLKKFLRQSPRGMVDLNAEIFPKKPASLKNPLLEEAKKYKSAEEFVNSSMSNKTFGTKVVNNPDSIVYRVSTPDSVGRGNGIFFGTNPSMVSSFAGVEGTGSVGRTLTIAKVNIKKPYYMDADELEYFNKNPKDIIEKLKKEGYDGIIEKNNSNTQVADVGDEWQKVAFDKSQIQEIDSVKDVYHHNMQIKLEEKLTDIWNKAKGTTKTTLLEEAKKYKSAEEFVNSFEKRFHQTSPEVETKIQNEGFKLGEMGSGHSDVLPVGINTKVGSEEIGIKARGSQVESYFPKNTNIKTFESRDEAEKYFYWNIPEYKNAIDEVRKIDNESKKILDSMEKQSDELAKTNPGRDVMMKEYNKHKQFIEKWSKKDLVYLNKAREASTKHAKDMKWDVLQINKDTGGFNRITDNTIVLKPELLKTKSQLTDIWNKAKGTTKTTLPVYKGETDLTTKILKSLEGKSTVSKQFIIDATNRGELKQVERDLVRRILDENYPTSKTGDYKMSHRPTEGVRAFDLTEKVDGEQMIPKDMYEQWYGSRGTQSDKESIAVLKKIRGNPDAEVTIYRASPENSFNDGDWVTFSKSYATEHAEGNGSKVHSKVVKAKDVRWAMDDVNEFGYYPAVKKASDTVNVQEFANKVKAELLPLKVNKARDMFRSSQGTSGGRYENIALPDDLRGNVKNYEERIYESPIKTSAGEVHFGQPKDKVEGYFGHTRIEDMADNQTRRVIEVQSDLYQKGGLEKENLSKDNGQYTLDEVRKISSLDDKGRVRMETREKELDKLRQYNDPTAHFRMIREEIKKAAEDGKTKLQFPTGETAMKIEGLGQNGTGFYNVNGSGFSTTYLQPSDLGVGKEIKTSVGNEKWIITDVLGDGKFKAVPKDRYEAINAPDYYGDKSIPDNIKEQFDISGKVDTNNPIYKFYNKEVRNYLNKFGGKEVKDDKGVSWIEIPIGKNSKGAVEAFGLLGAVGLGAAASGGEKAKAEGSAQTMPLLGNMPEEKQEAFLKKDENLLKGIYHPRGGVTVTEKDLSELEAILFGEISNRPLSKKMNEIRDIVNVALNRVENEGKTLKEVLQADNQFQAFKGKLYEMYKSGKAGQSVIEKEKVNAVRKVVDELRRGKFANTVGDNLSYAHLKDDTLKVYKNWSEQKKDLNNIK